VSPLFQEIKFLIEIGKYSVYKFTTCIIQTSGLILNFRAMGLTYRFSAVFGPFPCQLLSRSLDIPQPFLGRSSAIPWLWLDRSSSNNFEHFSDFSERHSRYIPKHSLNSINIQFIWIYMNLFRIEFFRFDKENQALYYLESITMQLMPLLVN